MSELLMNVYHFITQYNHLSQLSITKTPRTPRVKRKHSVTVALALTPRPPLPFQMGEGESRSDGGEGQLLKVVCQKGEGQIINLQRFAAG
jgi:hypothetical protein